MAVVENGKTLGEIRERLNFILDPIDGPEGLAAANIPGAVKVVHMLMGGALYSLVPVEGAGFVSGDGRSWRHATPTPADLTDILSSLEALTARVEALEEMP